jgi:uncharacterized protein YndB with AHSA1/START domain
MAERNVTHATFSIERVYDASPKRVFAAWSDVGQKRQWFGGPPDWVSTGHSLDFRVGGRESEGGGPQGGPMSHYDALYWDIVPDERIVTTYDMHLDGARISVSLATVEFKPAGAGTRLVYTEQGAYLDGWDNPEGRKEGTEALFDQLGAYLARVTADA